MLQPWQESLLFQRNLIDAGQVWRWTGNLIHTNGWHLGLNLGGFWLLIGLQQIAATPRTLLSQILFIGTGVGLGLWFFSPQVAWYAGFSGILYGLFMLSGVRRLQQRDWLLAAVLILGIGGKTVWDWLHNGAGVTAQWIDAPVIYAAHFYGMGSGLVLALLPAPRTP
ncbi:MAG: rhombosortase [Thiothrix lacustris]|uniref:Rhombosortase n=1 Tax=Thiothrix lacustris TaxID=525917 RepID=A0A1Y1QMV9_9GAMM|nr:MAG: rhombosortase [Thiothrix lacustris]